MAFYIDMDKIEHTKDYVRYKYYTTPENYGIIELNFITEKFIEIKPMPNDPHGLLFDRAALRMVKLLREGVFPDKTCWAS